MVVLTALSCATTARIASAGINVWTSGGPAGASITSLAVDPTTAGTVYAGGTDVFKSTDAGASWHASASGLPSYVNVLTVDPHTPSTLYAGTDGGGIFKSSDSGATWKPMNSGLTYLRVNVLAIDPHTPSTLYAGTYDPCFDLPCRADLLKSTDSAEHWQSSSSGLPAEFDAVNLAVDPLTPETVYTASGRESGLFKSTDGGRSWSLRGPQGGFLAFAIDPRMPSTFYAGVAGAGVIKSTDAGSTWASGPIGGYTVVDAIAIDASVPDTLYAARIYGTYDVLKSTDGGMNWSALTTAGFGDGFATALAVGTGPPPTLYATSGGVFAIQMATFAVNSTDDAPDAMPGDGVCATAAGACTLRAAVDEANALPGGTTIIVPAGTYRGGFAINVSLTLIGAGTASTRIDGGCSGLCPNVVEVASGSVVKISGLAIQNGGGFRNHGDATLVDAIIRANSAERHGGIDNAVGATLTLIDSTVSGNTAFDADSPPATGGGILNSGAATLINVTVTGNAAVTMHSPPALGGGIYNDGGTLMLTNVTVSDNTAGTIGNFNGGGGGIYNSGGTLMLTNGTISGNTAGDFGGGGLYNGGNATLTNVTISDNTASPLFGGDVASGSGIYNRSIAVLVNTIVANRASGGNCNGTFVSLGHNLDSDGTCGLTAATDLSNIDPALGPLQDNGGPTFTQALLPGSPAIDAGDDAVTGAPLSLTTDQRGLPRKVGLHVDIGAYESAPVSCAGDCDEHGTVTVDDLLTMVNIALGNAPVTACAAGDRNHDFQITVDEILAAVNNALNGCATV